MELIQAQLLMDEPYHAVPGEGRNKGDTILPGWCVLLRLESS